MSDEQEILVPEVVASRVPQFIPTTLIEQFKQAGAQTLADAKLFTVENTEEYNLAMEYRRQIRQEVDGVLKIADPICAGLHQAHAAACELRAAMTKDFNSAESHLDTEQKKHIERQREAEEKLKAQQLAEAKRLEDDRRKALAKELEKAGEPERAQEVLAAPMDDLVLPHTQSLMPKSSAGGNRQIWTVEVTDIIALARFVSGNPLLKYFIDANETALRKYAVDTKGQMAIPGVKFKQKDSISVKR